VCDLVPERHETLVRQLAELRSHRRLALLLTSGNEEFEVPGRYEKLDTSVGRFVYDPEWIDKDVVEAAVREDKIGDLLGYGISTKPRVGSIGTLVVVRDSSGNEVRAVVTDFEHFYQVREAAQAIMLPGDRLSLETPEQVLAWRKQVCH
jgi:hypothetical protein